MTFTSNRIIQVREILISGTGTAAVTVQGSSAGNEFRWFLFRPGSESRWLGRASAAYGGIAGFPVGPTSQIVAFDEVGTWCLATVKEGAATSSANFSVSLAAAPAYSPKDVNRDGTVDVVDVQLAVNIILSLHTPQYAGQGDANGDSTVDVVDVQNVVNCILSAGPCN